MGGRAQFAPTPPGDATLYGAKGGTESNSDLYTVDPDTGVLTSVGTIGFALTGMAFRPSDGVLFGVSSNNSAANPRSLVTIDPDTGAGTLVGALGVSSGIADIAFRNSDDALYGYSPSNRTLYSINTTTGAATQVSATAIPTSGEGYADGFSSADILYVFPKRANNVFYIVDPATGGLTAQTALSGATYSGGGILTSASFDEADMCWVFLSEAGGPIWHLAKIDVATSTIFEVAVVEDNVDALAWSVA